MPEGYDGTRWKKYPKNFPKSVEKKLDNSKKIKDTVEVYEGVNHKQTEGVF